MVSRSISLPLSGFFSSFPHGTCPLSVSKMYFALEGGPPRFRQNNTCSVLLRILTRVQALRIRDFHPLWLSFPAYSPILLSPYMSPTTPLFRRTMVWALLRPLAATSRISFDFFSYRYLDVSVPCVHPTLASFSPMGYQHLYWQGFPIRTSSGQSLFGRSPRPIVA